MNPTPTQQIPEPEILRITAEFEPFAVFWIDESGSLLHCNDSAAKLLQTPHEKLIGRYFWELDDALDCKKWQTIWERIKQYRTTEFENVITLDDNKRRIFETHATFYESGDRSFAICASFDITKYKSTEQALRDCEARHRLLIDNSPDPIIIHSNGIIRYANSATAKATGYATPVELIGMSVAAIIPTADRERVERFLLHCPAGDRPDVKEEIRLQHRNGIATYYEITCSAILYENEPAFQITTRDINDRKKASELLQSSQNHLIALYRLSQKSYLNEQDLIKYAIETAVHLTGSAAGYIHFIEDYNQTLGSFAWSNGVLERCSTTFSNHSGKDNGTIWAESARLKKPVVHNDNPAEINCSGFPEQCLTLARYLSVPVVMGSRVVLVAGVGNKPEPYDESDILQMQLFADGLWKLIVQKRTSDQLLESEEHYRQLFQSMINAFTLNEIVLDERGEPCDFRIIEANTAFAALLNKPLPEIIGKKYLDLVTQLDAEFIKACGVVALTGIPNHFELQSVNLNRYFEYYIYSPKPGLFAIVSSDISSRKRAEAEKLSLIEQLQQAQKLEAIGQLAGGVAHDFNNLLLPILGYSEILKMSMAEDDPLQAEVQEIYRTAERAKDLTRQLLAFSRKQTLEMKDIRLNEVIGNFEKILRRTIRENIQMTLSIPSTPITVRGDTGQIEQIVMNLVVNAKDAMPESGSIVIALFTQTFTESDLSDPNAKSGEYAVIAVTDTGAGIALEHQQKIFDPFFTTKAKGHGTGLGLSTVFGLVQQHNGFIQLFSEINKGTSFHICLPLLPSEEESVLEEGNRENIKGGNETILLVEDEQVVRDMTNRLLTILGYKVISTDSPETCLSHPEIYSRPIDLMLTDIIMPLMNGQQLYEYIKSFRPELKVLYMSGYTSDVLDFDVDIVNRPNFLQKPFNLETLAIKVREALQQSD